MLPHSLGERSLSCGGGGKYHCKSDHTTLCQDSTHVWHTFRDCRHLLYCWIVGGCLLLQISQVECIPKKPQSNSLVTSLFVGAIALRRSTAVCVSSNPKQLHSTTHSFQHHPRMGARLLDSNVCW
jgi:hypothetical protein